MKIQKAGFLLINKPKNIKSFAVVKHIRNIIDQNIRVGHGGTLDTFANGLLIIAVDRKATKHIRQLLTLDKTYKATGKLGELTDTLDHTGEILHTTSSLPTKEELEKAIASFGTSYVQTAPIYSALKHKGMRLSDLARNNQLSKEELDAIATLKQREINLYQLELLRCSASSFTIKAQVSSGTYIRALVHDIAKKTGSIATTYELERTVIGPFNSEHSVHLSELSSFKDIEEHLIDVEVVLDNIKKYQANYQNHRI